MKCRWKILFFIIALIATSCSARNNNTSNDYVIRYLNLNSVYGYLYSSSNEALDNKRKIDALNKKIDEIEKAESGGSASEINYYKAEIVKAREAEKKLKSEFYSRIKTAVNNVAVKHNADFILSSGDGVIYSRPVYDITMEVIKELKSLEGRTSPVFK